MGCLKRVDSQNATFDSKTGFRNTCLLLLFPCSGSCTYHTYLHLLSYTAWRTSFCFPSHFKGLYLTYMQPVFLQPWLQSSLMKSGSVATLCCRAGEEANHCLCRRPVTASCHGFVIIANRSKNTSWPSNSLVAPFCFSSPKAVPSGKKLVIPL